MLSCRKGGSAKDLSVTDARDPWSGMAVGYYGLGMRAIKFDDSITSRRHHRRACVGFRTDFSFCWVPDLNNGRVTSGERVYSAETRTICSEIARHDLAVYRKTLSRMTKNEEGLEEGGKYVRDSQRLDMRDDARRRSWLRHSRQQPGRRFMRLLSRRVGHRLYRAVGRQIGSGRDPAFVLSPARNANSNSPTSVPIQRGDAPDGGGTFHSVGG
jgi:hypothetical protein